MRNGNISDRTSSQTRAAFVMETRPGRSLRKVRNLAESNDFIGFASRDGVTGKNNGNTRPNLKTDKSFWELQYVDLFSRPHAQLNNFVKSNICFYIPNVACNTSSGGLKSPKIMSHDPRSTTLLVSDFIS